MNNSSLSGCFKKTIDRLRVGKKFVVLAVSGGADSVALLHLCVDAELNIVVANFDHNLRPESYSETLFVRALCQRLVVPYYSGKWENIPSSGNLYSEARKARYEFLSNICKSQGIWTILTGHHLDDQIETVIDRITRGSGISGLCGIREKGKYGELDVVRPLLKFKKEQLKDYLTEIGQDWVEDPSNKSSKKRSRIRHEVVPKIEEVLGESAVNNIANIADIMKKEKELQDWMFQEISKSYFQDGKLHWSYDSDSSEVYITINRKKIDPPEGFIEKLLIESKNKIYGSDNQEVSSEGRSEFYRFYKSRKVGMMYVSGLKIIFGDVGNNVVGITIFKQ